MKAQSVVLGETCLDDYITIPREMDEDREQKIDSLIGGLQYNALNVEKLPLKLLEIEKEKFPLIDPSFLSMKSYAMYKGKKMRAPRFSLYKKSPTGFERFSIELRFYQGGRITFFKNRWLPKNYFLFSARIRMKDIFVIPLLLSIGLSSQGEEIGILRKEKEEDYCPLDGYTTNISLSNSFHGILPQETKNKIKSASKIFGDDIYLISETRPEAWEATQITIDPLLVGVCDKRCFLIDHFHTTNIEEYVRKEFTY